MQEENLDEQIAETNLNYSYSYIAVISMDFSVKMFLAVECEIVCIVLSLFFRQCNFYSLHIAFFYIR